jgi:hypothetical protein
LPSKTRRKFHCIEQLTAGEERAIYPVALVAPVTMRLEEIRDAHLQNTPAYTPHQSFSRLVPGIGASAP